MIIFYKVSSLCNHHTPPKESNRYPSSEHSLLSPFDQYRLSPKVLIATILTSITFIIQCVPFDVLFLSLTEHCVCEIHSSLRVWWYFVLFSFAPLYSVCLCVIYDLFIHSVIDKHFNCFMFLTLMNNGVTNTFVQVFEAHCMHYDGHMPKTELLINRDY